MMLKADIEMALCDYVRSHGAKIRIGNDFSEISAEDMDHVRCALTGYFVGAKDYCATVRIQVLLDDAPIEYQGTFCAYISQDSRTGLPKISEPYDAPDDIQVDKGPDLHRFFRFTFRKPTK